jgi:hypothetical protein
LLPRVPVTLLPWFERIDRASDTFIKPIQMSKPKKEPMTQLDGVVRLLKTEHDRLSKQMHGIAAALSAFGAAFGKAKATTVRRKISDAGRARIADAQRRRWAKLKGSSGPTSTSAAIKNAVKRRTISAAGRKRIAAAQRARWAKLKANSKAS